MSEERILLTGATGFVGPHLLKGLKQGALQRAEIVVWSYTDDKSAGEDPFNVDIRSRQAVFAAIAEIRPTRIIHLAAQSHVPTAFSNPELTWDINVMGTLHLFEAVKKYVPAAGILHISTSEVYGKSFQSGSALNETAFLQPQNPYAASKAAADLMAGQYAAQGLHIIRLRPFNHFGPGQREDFVASAFAAQIARIEAGLEAPHIKVGNLATQRDFLDVRDVVRAYVLALEQIFELSPGLVLNICSGVPRQIEKLLTFLVEQAQCSLRVELDPDRLRPSDTPLALGDPTTVQRILDWTPRIAFNETLVDLLNDWRDRVR